MTESTRTVLLAKARAAFASHGYAGAPIEEVVRAAGLTKGALYHHFGSKVGLFEAVVRDLDREISGRLPLDLGTSDHPWRDLFLALRIYLEALLEPGVHRILVIDSQAVLGAVRARQLDQELTVQPLAEALGVLRARGFLADVDLEPLARLLTGALDEAALWIGESARPREALDRTLVTLERMLAGIATRPAPRRRTR